MLRKWIVMSIPLLIANLGAVNPSLSRDYVFENHARSGVPTRVRTFYDCQHHSPGGSGAGTAEHGTVASKFVVQNKCGNLNEPTNEYWYTSNPGFKGLDTVTIPATSGTNVVIKVTVN
jgi:hypothetical protein